MLNPAFGVMLLADRFLTRLILFARRRGDLGLLRVDRGACAFRRNFFSVVPTVGLPLIATAVTVAIVPLTTALAAEVEAPFV